MKMSVIYHSESGNTKQMAEVIVSGMKQVEGVEAQAFSIDAVDTKWIKESNCVIFGSPAYYASISGKMKLFLESLSRFDLAGKLGGAFATANNVHGGGELAMQTILDHLLVYGMIIYSSGGSQGMPPIHLGPEGIAGKLDESEETFRIYGNRMAAKAMELFH